MIQRTNFIVEVHTDERTRDFDVPKFMERLFVAAHTAAAISSQGRLPAVVIHRPGLPPQTVTQLNQKSEVGSQKSGQKGQ
jgi:hypothetical protein